MTPERRDTFISYVRHGRDYEVAVELSDALDEAGLTVWRDQQRLLPGHMFFERIVLGLRDSRSVLAVISQAALEREWTISEMFVGHAFRKLVPVVIDETEFSAIPFTIGQTVECVRYNQPEDLERIIAGIQEMTARDDTDHLLGLPADWNPPPDGTITAVLSMNLRLGKTDRRHPKFVEMQGRLQRSHQMLTLAQATNPELAAAYRTFNDPQRIAPGLLDLMAVCESLDDKNLWTALGDVATPFWPDLAVDAYLRAKMSDDEATERLPSTSVEELIKERQPLPEQEAERPAIVERARAARRRSGVRLRPRSAALPVEGIIATDAQELPEEAPPEAVEGDAVAAAMEEGATAEVPIAEESAEGAEQRSTPDPDSAAEPPEASVDVAASGPDQPQPETPASDGEPPVEEAASTIPVPDASSTQETVTTEMGEDAPSGAGAAEVASRSSEARRRRVGPLAVGLAASLLFFVFSGVAYVSLRRPANTTDSEVETPREPAVPQQFDAATAGTAEPIRDTAIASADSEGDLTPTGPGSAAPALTETLESAGTAPPASFPDADRPATAPDEPTSSQEEPPAPDVPLETTVAEAAAEAVAQETASDAVVEPELPPTCSVDGSRQLIGCRTEVGDYLWALSERMCGSPLRYLEIWELNRERLGRDDPDLVYVDELIELPPDCVGEH